MMQANRRKPIEISYNDGNSCRFPGDNMKIVKVNQAHDGKLQRGLLLASSAVLSVWAMPAMGQPVEPVPAEFIAKQVDAATKSPPPEFVRDFSIDGVTKEDATAIRYEGGVFQESAVGWTETRDSGDVFTYDLVTGRPGGNALVFHDADRNVGASISFANGAIFVRDARGALLRSHQATAVEAATRGYPRPQRPSMEELETASFDGGQLRRSLFGRWIRRDDDGQCTTYRLWNVDQGFFSIWDEENDDLLTLFVDTMRMASTSADPDGTRVDTLPLIALSGERDRDPMRDCNAPPSPFSAEHSGGESADFPLESFHYRNGLFMRLPNGQWRQLTGRGDYSVRGGELAYDIRESGADTLFLYNEENDVYAEVELDVRFLRIFSSNGVVDQQYQITATSPDYVWTTLPADDLAGDMTTADYDGGQFRMLGSATWVDVRDDGSCSYLREWSRDDSSITLLSHIGGERSLPQVEIDVETLTATVYGGFGYNAPQVETRQITATGVEPVGDNPTASCRSAQGS